MRPTVVVNLVGLSRSLLGPHTPTLQSIAAAGRVRTIVPPLRDRRVDIGPLIYFFARIELEALSIREPSLNSKWM